MNIKQIDSLLLMLEAILIIADLAIFGSAKVGMTCYWAIVAIYHLTDVVQGGGRKKDEDKDE